MRLQLSSRLALLLSVLLGACGGERLIAEPPPVDRAAFEADVYPILLRDCGYPACHGDTERFFRIFGPGRTRLDGSTPPYDPPTNEELDASFDRARSMLAAAPDPSQALLLRKPLEPSAGGASHAGLDELGRNVYATTEDPSWRVIARWAGAVLDEPDAGPRDAGVLDGGDAGDASRDASDASLSDVPGTDAADAP